MKKNYKTEEKHSVKTEVSGKRWLFRGIAIAIPFVFFVLLEGILRVSGFGRELPLFIINSASPDYLLPNPDIVKRYFPDENSAPNVSMEANFLLKEKPEDGIRIFVQGGSTAAGFPYGLGASIAGLLDQRIKDSMPGRSVEVINTAMSAVNSYTLLDFADEIIAQQPDAVLIYAGHNEFLGVLGVGSNYSVYNSNGANLLFLKVKNLRIFQALQQIYSATQSTPGSQQSSSTTSRTLMAQVAKHKDIAMDSDIFKLGLNQFERNMTLLLQKYQKAQIPVFIATIASNLKDQKPFASDTASQEELSTLAGIRNRAKAGENIRQELMRFSDSLLKNSQSADIHFELGHIFFALKQFEKARSHFTKAKDLDKLRFRAPESINTSIRSLAAKHNAKLVDAEQKLRARSEGEVIGSNLMLEHLHPNLQGYFVIANAFYDAIDNSKMFANWKSIPVAQAWKNRPILPAEEYYAFAKILNLKSDYPFTDKPQPLNLPRPSDWQQQIGYDYFSKKLDWLGMVQASRQGYIKANDGQMLLKIDRILADALPHSARANFNAGNSLQARQQTQLAKYYFQRALKAPDVTEQMKARINVILK